MPGMVLRSVNVGQPKEVSYVDRRGREKTTTTGIFKAPVAGPVMPRTLNLDGDAQADLGGHGGIYKAAYAYTLEKYRYWADALARTDFAPAGQFGENFTVEGMPDDEIGIGDVFRVGAALVEVSQPRVPCFKLGIRMGIPDFQKQFAQSCRVGFYLRVLEDGEVCPGDEFVRVRRPSVPTATMPAFGRAAFCGTITTCRWTATPRFSSAASAGRWPNWTGCPIDGRPARGPNISAPTGPWTLCS